MYLRLGHKYVGNGAISLIPYFASFYLGKYASEIIRQIPENVLLEQVLNDYPDNKNYIKDSYKTLISKIHMNLNKLGYKTDSSNLENLEIKLVIDELIGCENDDNFHIELDNELCTGYVIGEIISWRYHMKYEDSINHKKYNPLPKILYETDHGYKSKTYNVLFKQVHSPCEYMEKYPKYSKIKTMEFMNSIFNEMKKIKCLKNMWWNNDCSAITCTFNSDEDYDQFENEGNEILHKFFVQMYIREQILSDWFEIPHHIMHSGHDLYLNMELIVVDSKYILILDKSNTRYKDTLKYLLWKFNNLKKENIIPVIQKYFDFDGTNIYIDAKYLENNDYSLKFSEIRVNIYKMITELSNMDTNTLIAKKLPKK